MSDEADVLLFLLELSGTGEELWYIKKRCASNRDVDQAIADARAIHANLGVLIDEFEYKWKGKNHE